MEEIRNKKLWDIQKQITKWKSISLLVITVIVNESNTLIKKHRLAE